MNRGYYRRNAERLRKKSRDWFKNNKEQGRKTRDEWAKNNPEKVKRIYRKKSKRILSTPMGRLSSNMARAINAALRDGKNGKKWEEFVDFNAETLMIHLEKQFKPDMTRENYGRGGWHVDHKIPISAFNYEKPEDDEFKKCWSLDNLQPLWAEDNLKKGAKILKRYM